MPTYFDDDISGDAIIDFSSIGSHVVYVTFDCDTIPPRAGHPPNGLADNWLKIGFFSLGDSFDIGTGTIERWRDIEWWNWTSNLWTPIPSTDGSGSPTQLVATRLRYYVYPGGAGHLHVFGL
jgi:hypothetical protein